MTSPNPTWYDVLGVSRDATPEQVKGAWRDATDKFEPGSGAGQFRMFNEAADVLLDPQRRAAYDASLDDTTPGTSGARSAPAPVSADPPPTPSETPSETPSDDARSRPRHRAGAGSGARRGAGRRGSARRAGWAS